MRLRYGIAAGFAAGLLAALAVFGIVQISDGGDGGGSGDSVAVVTGTPRATDTADNGQVVATSGDCRSAADIYEDVRPSVVLISVSAGTGGVFDPQTQGTGTGVVIDEDGHIITNNHVVGNARTIEVQFDDGSTLPAEFVGSDPANDLAVIKIDPAEHDLTVADLGDSSDLRVGDPVLALGNPFNLEASLTQGIVSALDRTYATGGGTRPIRHMIQTDAAINPGNSGGPLLNCQGEVIGINSLLENPAGDSVNVGVAFAVAINTAKQSLDDMKAGRQVEHPWLGIAGADVNAALADELGLTVDTGAYVTLVSDGSPAERAGIVGAFASERAAASAQDPAPGGDVIIEADGREVTGVDDVATYLDENKQPGDTVELTIVRDGREITVTATLANWPS